MPELFHAYIPAHGPGTPTGGWIRRILEFTVLFVLIAVTLELGEHYFPARAGTFGSLLWERLLDSFWLAGIMTFADSIRYSFGGTEIVITEDALSLRKGERKELIRRADVRRIREKRPGPLVPFKGLIIDGAKRQRAFIPNITERYHTAREILSTWAPIE